MGLIDFRTAPAGTVFVWSKRLLNPLDLKAEDVDISDIAHSLARQCRYNGHCGGFLSVARHSIWVSDELSTFDKKMQLWGLLHDASEAYVGDLVSPLKRSEELKAFSIVEERIHKVIAERFELPYPQPWQVVEADMEVFWNRERPELETWDSDYRQDETDFLTRYRELT